MKTMCRIDTFKEEDRLKLDKFFGDVWTPPPLLKSLKWFDWKFKNDPNIGPSSPALLLAHLDGKVVGMHAITPTPLWVNGQVYEIGWGRDTFVDPDYRRHKIGLLMFEDWAQRFVAILGSGQSEAMRSLQVKYGWTQVAKVNQYEKLLFDKSVLRASIHEGLGKMSKRCLAMLYAQLRTKRFSNNDDTITHSIDFDQRVEGLWGECKREYERICSRDIRTLRWRFIAHPYYSYTISELIGTDGSYKGYLVTRREGNVCWFIDMLTRKNDQQSRLSLIQAAESYHRSRGVNRFISRSVCVFLESALKLMGYLSTTFEQFFCIKISGNLKPGNISQWYITSMDSDLDR